MCIMHTFNVAYLCSNDCAIYFDKPVKGTHCHSHGRDSRSLKTVASIPRCVGFRNRL